MKLSCHRFAISLTFAGILLIGCGGSGDSDSEPSYEFPVVGTLSAKRYEVLLHTAPDGPRYSLMESEPNEAGILLAREMTTSEFEKRFPLIHDEVRGLWAGSDLPANFSTQIPIERSPGFQRELSEPRAVTTELPPSPDLRNGD